MQNQFKNNPLELQSTIRLSKRLRVSVIGGLDNNDPPQSEAFDKVLKIVRERSQIENTPLVSVAIDPEGFLPTSFLETGIKYSQAVCRIARYFSHKSFIDFIGKIQQAIATQVNVSSNFDTVEKVIEVFSIPPQIAAEIFDIPVYQAAPVSQNPLDDLKKITENQLAKINPIPIGTGFLVGGSHLLTNHHVIESKEIAAQCVAQFNYVENAQGYIQKSIDYEFDPILFVTEPGLDYTLVQLKSGMFTRQAGYEFGWAQLIEDEESVKPGLDWVEFQGAHDKVVPAWAAAQEAVQQLTKKGYIVVAEAEAIVIWHPEGKYDQDDIKAIGVQMGYEQFSDASKLVSNSDHIESETGDAVIIVQHPKGKQKQIVLSNNKIIKNGLYQGVLRYKAESDYGSSGSPVFNTHWKLVALHHAAVPGSPESSSAQNQQSTHSVVKPVAQQGIRICRIIEDLRKKSLTNSKLGSFIQDFVIIAEQLNYPPLPAVARLNGRVSGNQKNGHFDCGNHESLDVSETITCEAWVAKRDDENGVIFHQNDEKNGYWVWWFMGKIRVQLKSDPKKSIVDTKKLAPQDGLWHHVVFTWRKSQKAQIYIDGEQQETEVYWESSLETPLGKPNAPVLIGAGDGFPCFGGDIAEVRLWKTDRSQTQIKETMYRRLTGDHSKEGLIGYWQFEEDRASKTYVYNLASPDGESNVPSIPLFTTPPQKIQLQFGLELNGENDYIDCGSFAIGKAITFEAWVKPNGRDQVSFIAGQGGSWGGQGYSLWWKNHQITVELQGDQTKIHRSFDVEMPDDDDWHHIAFRWSSDLPNICIYIDGKGVQDQESFTDPIGLSGMNLCIGRNKAITFYYFKGSIAEVRLWSVARSQEQINAVMNRSLSNDEIKDPQLVGYWPLHEQAGNEAANLASQDLVESQPGLVYGGTWLKPSYAIPYSRGDYGVPLGDVKWLKASQCSASLPLPCGLKFNGKEDQVNCGHDPSLNVPNTITVEAWVKHLFGNCLIVSRGCYVDDGYSLCWYDGKIRVMFQDQTTKVSVDTKENAPVDQVWHHIAFTWDKASQEIFIYVDGRQQDCVVMEGQAKSLTYAGQTKSTALFAGSLADLKTDLVIGRKTEEGQYYNVAITDVRLWKVVRTQDQIKTNMTCRWSHRDEDWQDLLGYWRLDDGGTQARNLVSDSNHGVIQGAQWFPAPPASASLSPSSTSTENPSSLTPST
jgi:V8-like Glu-specific endopeptidase